MHLSPTEGRPRDVAAAMVDSLYPPGVPARIPVISVTGTNGKTSTVRMIGQVLQQAGLRVGMACTDGVYVGGRLVYAADASGPEVGRDGARRSDRRGCRARDGARRHRAARPRLRPRRRRGRDEYRRRPPRRRRHRRSRRADPRQGAGRRGDPRRRIGRAQRRRPGDGGAGRPAGGARARAGRPDVQPVARTTRCWRSTRRLAARATRSSTGC